MYEVLRMSVSHSLGEKNRGHTEINKILDKLWWEMEIVGERKLTKMNFPAESILESWRQLMYKV